MADAPIVAVSNETQPPDCDLRWFAGLAMQAIIAKQETVPDTKAEREEIALWAYRMAEEMVATENRLHLESK